MAGLVFSPETVNWLQGTANRTRRPRHRRLVGRHGGGVAANLGEGTRDRHRQLDPRPQLAPALVGTGRRWVDEPRGDRAAEFVRDVAGPMARMADAVAVFRGRRYDPADTATAVKGKPIPNYADFQKGWTQGCAHRRAPAGVRGRRSILKSRRVQPGGRRSAQSRRDGARYRIDREPTDSPVEPRPVRPFRYESTAGWPSRATTYR